VPTVAAQPRQLSLETPLGPGALTLVGLSGREAISELFGFELDLVAASGAAVPFDQLVGRPMTAGLGTGRFVNGIVSRFSSGVRDGWPQSFRAELVPRLWLLTRTTNSRIFQNLSLPEIAEAVLAGHGQSATFELQGIHHPRNTCVQYRETDFAFLRRILVEEGIWFAFRHTGTGHELVLGDGTPPGPGLGTFPFDERGTDRPDPPRVLTWEKTQELTAESVTLRDHHFELPDDDLEGTAAIQDSVRAGQVTHRLRVDANAGLEVYDYPGGYADRFDGIGPGGEDRPGELEKLVQAAAHAAAVRVQEEAARSLVLAGRSTCSAFTAGAAFTLAGHADADGGYVLTQVQHWATQPASSGGAGGFRYSNAFTCIPEGLPYRPPRVTPAPVAGPQTALVTGPAGARTHVDEFGRVKVRFYWDRTGSADESSSCWIRVVQPVGGAGDEFFWLPEVGDEVVVAFEHGDPDRPYVLGRVFNADDRPPDDR
jgi:type VI secretion system secreted protein VgrG